MEERKTTAFIRNILAENGVRLLETGLETGVIAALGKGEGPTVALRADIAQYTIHTFNAYISIEHNTAVYYSNYFDWRQ